MLISIAIYASLHILGVDLTRTTPMTANPHQTKIEAIREAGMTYTAIARRAGCDISTLFRIRQGEIPDPKYSVGRAIDQLHSEVCAGTLPAA